MAPADYAVRLVPDIANDTFSGSGTVDIRVRKATRRLVLNAAALRIDDAGLHGAGRRPTAPGAAARSRGPDPGLSLARPMAPGRYRLALRFRGAINREGRGLVRAALP